MTAASSGARALRVIPRALKRVAVDRLEDLEHRDDEGHAERGRSGMASSVGLLADDQGSSI